MFIRTIKIRFRSTTEGQIGQGKAQIGQGKGQISPIFWHFFSYLSQINSKNIYYFVGNGFKPFPT